MLTKDSKVIKFINKYHPSTHLLGKISGCEFISAFFGTCWHLLLKFIVITLVVVVIWVALLCMVQSVYDYFNFPQEWLLALPKNIRESIINSGYIFNAAFCIFSVVLTSLYICDKFKIDLNKK